MNGHSSSHDMRQELELLTLAEVDHSPVEVRLVKRRAIISTYVPKVGHSQLWSTYNSYEGIRENLIR